MDLDQVKEARLEIDVNFIQKEILGMGEILSERILKKKKGGGEDKGVWWLQMKGGKRQLIWGRDEQDQKG